MLGNVIEFSFFAFLHHVQLSGSGNYVIDNYTSFTIPRNIEIVPTSGKEKTVRSGFFPLDKQHFLVVTDEHHTLQLRVEQQNDKAITTPASNALLGEYFRNRLGLSNGAYVRKDDLLAYGRTDVTFYKIDEEQYYMDFSVEEK